MCVCVCVCTRACALACACVHICTSARTHTHTQVLLQYYLYVQCVLSAHCITLHTDMHAYAQCTFRMKLKGKHEIAPCPYLFIHPLPNRTFQRNTIHGGQKKLQSLSRSQELLGAQKVWYGLAAFRKSCLQHFNCTGVSVPGYIHFMTLPSPEVAIGKTSMEKFINVLSVTKRSLAEVWYC